MHGLEQVTLTMQQAETSVVVDRFLDEGIFCICSFFFLFPAQEMNSFLARFKCGSRLHFPGSFFFYLCVVSVLRRIKWERNKRGWHQGIFFFFFNGEICSEFIDIHLYDTIFVCFSLEI